MAPDARRLEDYRPEHRRTVSYACAWKPVYATANEALEAARAANNGHTAGVRRYPCPFLHPGAWHVGHPPTAAGLVRLAAAVRNLPPARAAPAR